MHCVQSNGWSKMARYTLVNLTHIPHKPHAPYFEPLTYNTPPPLLSLSLFLKVFVEGEAEEVAMKAAASAGNKIRKNKSNNTLDGVDLGDAEALKKVTITTTIVVVIDDDSSSGGSADEAF